MVINDSVVSVSSSSSFLYNFPTTVTRIDSPKFMSIIFNLGYRIVKLGAPNGLDEDKDTPLIIAQGVIS